MAVFPYAVWLNPQPESHWQGIYSLQMVRELMEGRMFPMTLDGLGEAVSELSR